MSLANKKKKILEVHGVSQQGSMIHSSKIKVMPGKFTYNCTSESENNQAVPFSSQVNPIVNFKLPKIIIA